LSNGFFGRKYPLVISQETDKFHAWIFKMKRSFLKRLPADLCAGSISGFLATGPMTLVMSLLHKYLVFYDQHSPPPKKITLRIARKAGISVPVFKQKKRKTLTVLSHYGYGASAGVLYPVWSKQIPMHPAINGTLYGLLVWAASYLGWLPLAGLWTPTRESKGRRFTMIAAHIVWGASTAIIHSRMKAIIKKSKRKGNKVYPTPETN
jgi:uncharacterized membrane protein YagU involved in acid resistance